MHQRLAFIDIAKGIGILVVTLGHFGVSIGCIHLSVGSMLLPMFWLVSGYFFSPGKNWCAYLKKRSSQLLLPFVGFNLLSAIIVLGVNLLKPGSIGIDMSNLLRKFSFEYYCLNGPTWFLFALYWLCLIYYVIQSVRTTLIRWGIILLLAGLGCWCSLHNPHIVLPLFIDVALTALPFYAFGHEFRKYSLFDHLPSRYVSLFLTIILFAFVLIIENKFPAMTFGWAANIVSVEGNPLSVLSVYLFSLIALSCLILLSKGIERLPFLQFVGRHSLLLLCVQQPVYRIVLRLVNSVPVFEAMLSRVIPSASLTVCLVIMYLVELFQAKKALK